ncbi:MAG: hypothetical protein HY918_02225 [Candidatus Doudnabacteria bacterium]|nr:hypothetical protein [Candidatus Doudnabacteria bacterium]
MNNSLTNPKNWETSIRWEYLAYPFFSSLYNLAAKKQTRPYHVVWDKFLCNFENGFLIAFLPTKKMSVVGNKIITDTKSGKKEYSNIINKIYKEINWATTACLKAQSTSDIDQFIKLWPKIQKSYSEIANIYFHFDFALDEELKKIQLTDSKLFELLQNYIFQGSPSFMSQAQFKLVELEKKYKGDLNKIYPAFNLEFGWFLNSYAGVFKLSPKWLDAYIKKTSFEVSAIKKIIKLDKIPKKYQLFAKLAKTAVTFRDDKKKLQLIAIDLMDKWLRFECEKKNWNFHDMRWLSMDEVFKAGKTKDISLVKKAKIYSKLKNRIGIMTPTGYLDITKKEWNKILTAQNKKNPSIIKGLPANPGIYIGKAKIIHNPITQRIKKGEILVTSMTRPEFMPLMNLAGAFVTDSGGITCHAAIVAREMKKPCIIGTKIATKVFKDGDIIEVDANKGTVKKIN